MTNVSSDLCVIITARDAATTIGDAISSALGQPQVGEVVLVDDASSDQTADIALQNPKATLGYTSFGCQRISVRQRRETSL